MEKLQSAAPVPASTVVLVRPNGRGAFEVFMNRRPEKMQTYAGAYVFPGGCVEPADYSPEMIALTQGVSPPEAKSALGSDLDPEICLGHWVAAIRELFEEVGVHFFVRASGAPENAAETLPERLLQRRSALQSRGLKLATLLREEFLRCELRRLAYFFHRITPEHYKVRFDTRFFLAALPVDQTPLESSEEVVESLWIAPQAALNRLPSGAFPMLPPTVAVLRMLAEQGSWEALLANYHIEA